MYKLKYKYESEVYTFDKPSDVIKYFDSKGWGIHNFIVMKDDEEITHEEFFKDLDTEKYSKY